MNDDVTKMMMMMMMMMMMKTGTMIMQAASGFAQKSVSEVDIRTGARAAGKHFIW